MQFLRPSQIILQTTASQRLSFSCSPYLVVTIRYLVFVESVALQLPTLPGVLRIPLSFNELASEPLLLFSCLLLLPY